jgi:hypothetical protein
MSAVTERSATSPRERVGAPRRRVAALATIEARRTARSPLLWIGVLLAAALTIGAGDRDYQAGGYTTAIGATSVLAFAGFVLAVRAGTRDRTGMTQPLAADAVMGADERATARLLGTWPVVAVGALYAFALGAVEWVEGGWWIGDAPRRTDSAVHGVVELLQPPAMIILACTAGVAIGRSTAQRTLVCLLGAIVVVVAGLNAWVLQAVPVRYVTILQEQPVRVDLPTGVRLADLPSGWLLERQAGSDGGWRRVVVSGSMSGWHSVYLIGVGGLLAGWTIRRRAGLRLAAVALVLVAVGVAGQVIVAPTGAG